MGRASWTKGLYGALLDLAQRNVRSTGSHESGHAPDKGLKSWRSMGLALLAPDVLLGLATTAGADGFPRSRLLDGFPERYVAAYRSEFDAFVDLAGGNGQPVCTGEEA
jgi:hypothetical protein